MYFLKQGKLSDILSDGQRLGRSPDLRHFQSRTPQDKLGQYKTNDYYYNYKITVHLHPNGKCQEDPGELGRTSAFYEGLELEASLL